MNSHIQSLLQSREYSEELKEEAAIRILFGGEDPANVMECLNISSIYVVNNFVNIYRKKIENGLITLPPMDETQKHSLHAIQQRNKELERAVKDANLMILALNNMIDIAEAEGTAQTVISLRENRNADAGVECLCRLTPGAPVGYSRQSFYSKQQYLAQQNHDQLLVLDLVAAIRRDILDWVHTNCTDYWNRACPAQFTVERN